nr:hypothetical protein CPGR_04135 [Mycolicibacterium malmesburyense]
MRTGRRLDQPGAVTELFEPVVFDLVEQIDRGQAAARVVGEVGERTEQPLDKGLDARRVEHIGAVLHRPGYPEGFTGGVPAFLEGEREVHAGGVGVDGQRVDLNIA